MSVGRELKPSLSPQSHSPGKCPYMLRIAVVFSALVALATSQCPEAATPSSAPESQFVLGPGITVIDQSSLPAELSEAPITFSKSLGITLTVNSTVDATRC